MVFRIRRPSGWFAAGFHARRSKTWHLCDLSARQRVAHHGFDLETVAVVLAGYTLRQKAL
jgi:hypothetical protein